MGRQEPEATEPRLICAWCGKTMATDAEVIALSAKIKPEFRRLAQEQAGQIIDFHLLTTDRDIPAVVAGADSQARKDGKDLIFPNCSMACAKALDATIRQEKSLVDPAIG